MTEGPVTSPIEDRHAGTWLRPSVRQTKRRRRPTGSPPPLPRSLGFTGRTWLVALGLLLGWVVLCALLLPARRLTDQVDAAVLRSLARLRTEPLTVVLTQIDRWLSGWLVTIVAASLIIALIVFKRWRHLFTFIGAVALIELVGGQMLYNGFARPRPYDVETIGRWAGFSLPSPPVAVALILALGIAYGLAVPGRPRQIAKWAGAAVVAVFALARLYLAVDHPFDILVGVALTGGVLVNGFRFFTPNEAFPVVYRRGKTAHLDVSGRRGEAVKKAVEEQLGLTVEELKPVGLAGSGGSTPLRLTVAGDPGQYLFAKLYSMTHVRADRWYKMGRTILYGRLEDEAPFRNVRRLVQYEDYAARLVRDAGIPTADTFGIVELTPEREYLLVTEFLDGAIEIGEAEVDDDLIDQGLGLVRRMWDAGIAHRDIKPANLMVHRGQLKVIDVAFAQVRPSPWRQAIDLANMMLVLAVRSDAERVYARALLQFTPDEIAEAFAAVRGIASPTQLRSVLKQDGRDLVSRFRELAPARPPIRLQRWGVRRFLLAAAVLLVLFIAVQTTVGMITPAHDIEIDAQPECATSNVMILMAQSVPSATAIPCVSFVPGGWGMGTMAVNNRRGTFSLDSDLAGEDAVAVTLRPPGECSVEGAIAVPSDEEGLTRFERAQRLPPDMLHTRYYVFDGGCVTLEFSFVGDAEPALMIDMDQAIAFLPRSALADEVERRSGLHLCGAGQTCVG